MRIKVKKTIWNLIVVLAIFFLLFMFGANYSFGSSASFRSIPMPPSLPNLQLKTVKIEAVISDKFFAPKSLSSLSSQPFFQAKSNAIAWVVQANVAGVALEQLMQKLKNQKWPVYKSLFDAGKAPIIFVGPYVHRKEAEQMANQLKKTFGLAGEVVKFDPLVM